MTDETPFQNPWDRPAPGAPAEVSFSEPTAGFVPSGRVPKMPGRGARIAVGLIWRLIRAEFVLAILVTVVGAAVLAIAVYQMYQHQPIAAVIGPNRYIPVGTYLILPVAAKVLLAGVAAWIGSGAAAHVAWPNGSWDTITPGAGWRALIALCVLPVVGALSFLLLSFLFLTVLPGWIPEIQRLLDFTPHAITVTKATL
jgi:hypothetical protein